MGRSAGTTNTPVRADIVIYKDFEYKQPFIVIETKAPGETQGIRQVESYARNLGAEFHVWSNGDKSKYFRTARYADQSESIGNIPYWIGNKPIVQKVSKSEILPPFKNEEELEAVVSKLHTSIWEKEGHDPAKAFDELTKLFFLKVYDERETPNFYEFVVLSGENEVETAKRIRTLFAKAVTSSRYADVFETKFYKYSD